MTLSNLAKIAGVSVATVSKAFSGSSEISEETRERIFEIARREGCFDKYNKNKFHKPIIAVICPEIDSAYYNAIVTLLNREITDRGAIMAVSVGDFSEEVESELFNYYSSYCHADGIILINTQFEIKNPMLVPTVALGHMGVCKNADVIDLDFDNAILEAVLYLKSQGHTEIGFAGERLTSTKLRSFQNSMRRAGLRVSEELVRISNERFERAGIDAVESWSSEGRMPTAIIAAYDNIAVGVIKALRKNGFEVPRDVSVIGMDDIPIATYLTTPLSTIKTHVSDACRMSVELVMKKIENQYYKSREEIVVASEFVVRESTGEVRNGR